MTLFSFPVMEDISQRDRWSERRGSKVSRVGMVWSSSSACEAERDFWRSGTWIDSAQLVNKSAHKWSRRLFIVAFILNAYMLLKDGLEKRYDNGDSTTH